MKAELAERIVAAIILDVDSPATDDFAGAGSKAADLIAAAEQYGSVSSERIWAAIAEYPEGAAFGVGRHWRSHRSVLDSVDEQLSPITEALRRHVNLRSERSSWLLGELPTTPISDSLRRNAANLSLRGTWWVCPEGVPVTVDDDAVSEGEHFIRDDFQVRGVVKPVRIAAGARILEVNTGDDWCGLVSAYGVPSPVLTYDWGVRGSEDPWLPDWERVARDFDAVHVSISGFLRAAYRPIHLNGSAWTVLAGWHPGSTVWLRAPIICAGV